MLPKNFIKKSSLLLTTTFFVFSCAKSDKNDLKEAQICLNTAPPSEALGCTDKIASDQSAQAYKLRCAAVFISEGFNTPTSFIDALDKINSNSGSCTGGCSSTVGAISALSFKTGNNATTAEHDRSKSVANMAFSYCSLAETPIYMQISSIFKIGTLAYVTAGVASPTEDQIKAALSGLPNAEVGDLVIATYNSTCNDIEKASDATKKYCQELSTAISLTDGTNVQVGSCLKKKLADPNATCP